MAAPMPVWADLGKFMFSYPSPANIIDCVHLINPQRRL